MDPNIVDVVGLALIATILIDRIAALYQSNGNIFLKVATIPLLGLAFWGYGIYALMTLPVWFLIGAIYACIPHAKK